MNQFRLATPRIAAVALLCAPAWAQATMRMNVSSAGVQANFVSLEPSISASGRFVVFTSYGNNLVSADANSWADIFVRDRDQSTTERISVSSSGIEGNSDSVWGTISADGRFVAFQSVASTLVPGDTFGRNDVFVRDRQAGTTVRVSVATSGAQATNDSYFASISGDGRYVSFTSAASNLVTGDTNGVEDVFIRDLQTGTTERVSLNSSGTQGNGFCLFSCLSFDGRYVAFVSSASNLAPGDTPGTTDLFVRDRQTEITECISVGLAGTPAGQVSEPSSISADGNYVAFTSAASTLVSGDSNSSMDVFLRDRLAGVTQRVSVSSSAVQGNANSFGSSISADGRCVTFRSHGTNLVSGDTNGVADVFLRDRQTGITERISVSSAGSQANDASDHTAISGDGRYVAFDCYATNLVALDTNNNEDVFLRDRLFDCSQSIASYCTGKLNSAGCTPNIVSTGAASATPGQQFLIGAQQVLPDVSGLLLYGVHGADSAPFQGGFLCVKPPTRRTPLQTSNSAGAAPCVGLYSFDFNLHIASGSDPALVIGQQVWSQYWMRDSASPSTTGLSNGLTFVICL